MGLPVELLDSGAGSSFRFDIRSRVEFRALIALVRRAGFVAGHALRLLTPLRLHSVRRNAHHLLREFPSALLRGVDDRSEDSSDIVLSDSEDSDNSLSI